MVIQQPNAATMASLRIADNPPFQALHRAGVRAYGGVLRYHVDPGSLVPLVPGVWNVPEMS